MNNIGQKVSQLIQSTQALSTARKSAAGLRTTTEMTHKAGQLSNRFIQIAGQQATKGIPPTKPTFGLMTPTFGKMKSLAKANFSSKTGGSPPKKFSFLQSQDLAPVKEMHTALRDFSCQFDNEGLAAKEINHFSSTCYNLQIAKGSDEIGLAKSLVHSSLTKCIKLLTPTIHPDQNPSPSREPPPMVRHCRTG